MEQSIGQNKDLAKLVLDKSIQNCSESEQDGQYTRIVFEDESEDDFIILEDSDLEQEYTYENLKIKKKKELQNIAKEIGLKGR